MSELPTTDLPEATAEHCAQALTTERIESILADFRGWLHEAAAHGATIDQPDSQEDRIDLHTLLGQFIALRHEVNLQTKAVRAQQEQNAQTLAALQEAAVSTPSMANDEIAQNHARTLMEIYDALALAVPEAKRMRDTILADSGAPVLEESTGDYVPASARPSFMARIFGGAHESQAIAALRHALAVQSERLADARRSVERARGLLSSLLTGYTMSLQRLERALQQNELEPIECVGRPFDPERMEALEVVADNGRIPGEVVDEVRRGYLRRGRVFRCAQVRIAKKL
jgi:molecular chaperone GrpE